MDVYVHHEFYGAFSTGDRIFLFIRKFLKRLPPFFLLLQPL